MSNSFGDIFQITIFGESHGAGIGVVIDGCPAGVPLIEDDVQKEVDKRKPVPGAGQTPRLEEDRIEIFSGTFQGRTTGAPLVIMIHNRDTDSSSYERIKSTPRPGHADYTAFMKYGGFNDYRGGGRFSGRVTAGMVMAGAVAKKLLGLIEINVLAFTSQIGGIQAKSKGIEEIVFNVANSPLRCADPEAEKEMSVLIEQAAQAGDSLGGVISAVALNMPVGLGEPIFDTLEGELSKALFAIPAIKGVEFGDGFAAAGKRGSENNDAFMIANKTVMTATNHSGGILGGISNGMPLVLRVAVKPTPSISAKQGTINLENMENTEIEIKGRHDVCIVPRAVIVVESMISVTLCNFAMREELLKRVIK